MWGTCETIQFLLAVGQIVFLKDFIFEPRHEKTGFFAYAKTKTQISLRLPRS